MSLLPFAVTFVVVAGLLALFPPSKQVLLLGLAAAMGIVAQILVEWWTPAKTPGEVYQIRYMLTALPALCALAAILGYRRPRQGVAVGRCTVSGYRGLECYGTVCGARMGQPRADPLFVSVLPHPALAAIPAIIAAELAAHIARRRQKALSGS